MSEKNALAILGSPHTNGTTAAMLNFIKLNRRVML